MKANPRSRTRPASLGELNDRFEHAIVVSVGDDGYPLSVATDFWADARAGEIQLGAVEPAPPMDHEVALVFSHIRPQPGQPRAGQVETKWDGGTLHQRFEKRVSASP